MVYCPFLRIGRIHKVVYEDSRPDYRLIDQSGLNMDSNSMHLFELPADCITEIIIGARATKQLAESLSLLAKSGPLAHVTLSRAVLDPSDYALLIEECE